MQRRCSRLDTDHFWGLLIHTHFIFSFYLTCNHIIMTASSYSLSLVPLACYPPGPGMVSGMGLLTLTATVIDSLALYILYQTEGSTGGVHVLERGCQELNVWWLDHFSFFFDKM